MAEAAAETEALEGKALEQSHPGYHVGDPVVLDFTTPEKDERPWELMTLDGHPVMVREPKSAYFLDVATRVTDPDEEVQLKATNDILFNVFDADSRAHIKERLANDTDDFDLDELGDVVNRLQEHWGKGRGGSAKKSAASSSRRTTRSTARRR